MGQFEENFGEPSDDEIDAMCGQPDADSVTTSRVHARVGCLSYGVLVLFDFSGLLLFHPRRQLSRRKCFHLKSMKYNHLVEEAVEQPGMGSNFGPDIHGNRPDSVSKLYSATSRHHCSMPKLFRALPNESISPIYFCCSQMGCSGVVPQWLAQQVS
jgi:hypothetical protein